jgi:hypothetical protein
VTTNAGIPLDDAELMTAFERAALPAEGWNHRAYVRVAFGYARRYDLETAVVRMRAGPLALNAAHQVPEGVGRGYHETITVAFLRLIRAACQRAARQGRTFASSTEFCDAHPQLMTKDALLLSRAAGQCGSEGRVRGAGFDAVASVNSLLGKPAVAPASLALPHYGAEGRLAAASAFCSHSAAFWGSAFFTPVPVR